MISNMDMITLKENELSAALTWSSQSKSSISTLTPQKKSFVGREEAIAALCVVHSTGLESPWLASERATSTSKVPAASRFPWSAMEEAESFAPIVISIVGALVVHGGKLSVTSFLLLGSVGLACRKAKSTWEGCLKRHIPNISFLDSCKWKMLNVSTRYCVLLFVSLVTRSSGHPEPQRMANSDVVTKLRESD